MFDPGDNCSGRTGRSWVGEPTTATLTLPYLPQELILRIASLLEVRDLLALRMSRRSIYNLTHDKHLWRGLLRDLRPPLPRALRSRCPHGLSYHELEKAVLHSCAVGRQWLKWRGPGLTLLASVRLRLLGFLDDRWVISIPALGPPTIWDTQENPPKLWETMLYDFQDETLDATVAVDPHKGDIVMGLRKIGFTLQVLRVHLTEPRSHPLPLTNYGNVPDLSPGIIVLEPSKNAIITEMIGIGIQVRDWTCGQSVMVSTPRANYDHAYEPILGLRLVGDYILSFRSRWIELLYVPRFLDADEQPASERGPDPYLFGLNYPEVALTGASLSEPQPNPESPDNSRIIYILAHQTTIGFFYFRVTIYNPDYVPSGPRARMEIDLIGVLGLGEPYVGIKAKRGPRLALSAELGPEGKRGIWVERSLGGLKRFIVAVTFDQNPPAGVPVESGDNLQELCEIAPHMESMQDVYIVESWNPNDDVIRCAFSESTGKIVLGTRDNRIILV